MLKARICFLVLSMIAGASFHGFSIARHQQEDDNPILKYSNELVSDLSFASGNINSIVQDQRGFLWFGSWDGLFMYDGYSVKTYKPRPGFQDCFRGRKIRKVFSDSRGRLWVGTTLQGLHLFDQEQQCFRQFVNDPADPHSLAENDIMGIWEDSKKGIWLVTTNGYVAQIEEKGDSIRFNNYRSESKTIDFLSSYYLASDVLWIGTTEGLARFDMKSPGEAGGKANFEKVHLGMPFTLFGENIPAVFSEWDGDSNSETVWAGTQNGVWKLMYHPDDGLISSEKFLINPGFPNSIENRIKVIFQTRKEREDLWIGTDEGVFKLAESTGKAERFKMPEDQPGVEFDKVVSFYEDNSGVIWIGTSRGIKKVHKYRKEFNHIDLGENRSGAGGEVKGFAHGNTGRIYIATHGLGVVVSEDKAFSSSAGKPGFFKLDLDKRSTGSKFINSIATDDNGYLWAGSDGNGLYRVEVQSVKAGKTANFRHYNINVKGNYISDSFIYSMLSDKKGNFWVGTYQGGLNRYDYANDKFVVYDKVEGLDEKLSDFPLVKILEGSSGKIWIGTRGNGIYIFTPAEKTGSGTEKFMKISSQEDKFNGLADNFITDLYEDGSGRMWIGTEAGLSVMETKTQKFTSFTKANGFPGDHIQSIIGYNEDEVWLSSKSGIIRVNVFKDTQGKDSLVFHAFNYSDGIGNKFFNVNSALKTGDCLAFGGLTGITSFRPEDIRSNPFIPAIALIDFELNHKTVPVGQMPDGRTILSKDINETEEIVLEHQDKIITFEFSALHYADPDKNLYAYKMEGFDDDWIYTDANRRFAHYTNLSPGEYVFKVKASNNDGLWSNESKNLKIKVLPPFWLTSWAFIMYFLFLLALFILIRQITLMRANLKHKIEIERLEREKSDQLHNIELQYFTNISHEIRTPLTLILGPLEKLIGQHDLNARLSSQLQLMHHHGQRLYRLLNQLMDFRKQGMGQMKLKTAEGNIVKFVREIFISFRETAFDRKIDYQFKPETEEMRLFFDRDLLEKVLYNLLSNAFKYNSHDGKISISVTSVDPATLKNSVRQQNSQYDELYDKNYVAIEVEDSGQGISKEDLSRIFERFYRSQSNTTRSTIGTGIGLSLAKELVLIHKGAISVSSEISKGAKFTVYLPTGSEHLSNDEILAGFKDSENQQHYLRARGDDKAVQSGDKIVENSPELPKVLVVEDNEDVRNFVRSILQPSCEVVEAANGKEGWEKAMDEVPDLIISDVMMPEMDGIELCSCLKKDEKTSHIPVVLLTARTSLIFKVEGIETGADDYITKPFNPAYLEARVKNLIEQRKSLKKKFSEKLYVKPKDITVNSLDETFLQKTIDLVNKNMSDSSYDIDKMCDDLAMSRMQLYRKLKALTGLSANEFVRTQRLQRAAQLLEQSQLTISQITYEVGFNDLKYFRVRFSEQFGMTPSEYAAKHKKQKTA